MDIPDVDQVAVLPDYHLQLRFTNGETRIFDVTPYLDRGVFHRLRDERLFARARVTFGTVTWPGELDIAPETLYLRSTHIQDELEREETLCS